jgi:hypothetical protein
MPVPRRKTPTKKRFTVITCLFLFIPDTSHVLPADNIFIETGSYVEEMWKDYGTFSTRASPLPSSRVHPSTNL